MDNNHVEDCDFLFWLLKEIKIQRMTKAMNEDHSFYVSQEGEYTLLFLSLRLDLYYGSITKIKI